MEKGSMFKPPRPHDMAQHMRDRLRSRLALTPEQLQKIDPIIQKTSDDLNAIHQETVARAAQITENCNAQIAASLSPEQRQKLDQMEKEHRGFLEQYQHHDNHHDGLMHGHL
jgi:Spy/CpxP family protein refolding chaperone